MNEQGNPIDKRIAIFLPGLYNGGAERVMLNLAMGIAERGYLIDLILSQAEGPYTKELPTLPQSVRVIELNKQPRKFSRTLFSLPALVKYLRHEKPMALLSGLHANIIALWAKKISRINTRLVITEHNTFTYQNQLLPAFLRVLMHISVRMFYPWADSIIAVSSGAADDLMRVTHLPRTFIKTIYNPIITPELKIKANLPVDHPWFAQNEPPVIVSIGRLTQQKDFPTLIHAFHIVRQSNPVRLIILGEGEDRPALERLIQQLGIENDVAMPGFIQNPYPYLTHAALYVLSSRWEGLPTVLVEALYCNVPIIATDCPSGPREILQNGLYGQLVPMGDAKHLANVIKEQLDGQALRAPSESWHPYEMETVTDQYLHILCDD